MSEKNNDSVRYKIEDDIEKILKGDSLKNAQDFIAFLKNSRVLLLNPDSYGDNWGSFLMHVYDDAPDLNPWYIYWHAIEDIEHLLDNEMKEFLWENVRICTGHCGCENWPRGGDQIIFGKELKSTCSSRIMFHNPDAEKLKKIEKLVLLTK